MHWHPDDKKVQHEPLIDPDVVPGAEGHGLPAEPGPEAEES